MVTDNFLSTLN
ncbi:unnamed protein product, partial [Rotaria magnacalcarata]